MVNIKDLNLEQMKRIVAIKAQIQSLEEELEKVVSDSPAKATGRRGRPAAASNGEAKPAKKKRKISAAGRARIAAATKARWAKFRASKGK